MAEAAHLCSNGFYTVSHNTPAFPPQGQWDRRKITSCCYLAHPLFEELLPSFWSRESGTEKAV